MTLFEHPDDFIQRFNEQRERSERRAQHIRALRGATPPFDGAVRDRLTSAMVSELAPAHPCLDAAAGGRP